MLPYRAGKLDRDICLLKPQCCPKEPARKIPRDIHEYARDVARSFAGTEAFEQSRREKKIEMRFAHLKRILPWARMLRQAAFHWWRPVLRNSVRASRLPPEDQTQDRTAIARLS